MEKVKVGIVGCGYIGRTHAMAFSYTPRVEIVAAADKNEERAKELAAKYKAKPYGDYTDMIDSGELDAVSIALPSRLHAEATVYALKHGLHVLCEKPMAPFLIFFQGDVSQDVHIPHSAKPSSCNAAPGGFRARKRAMNRSARLKMNSSPHSGRAMVVRAKHTAARYVLQPGSSRQRT